MPNPMLFSLIGEPNSVFILSNTGSQKWEGRQQVWSLLRAKDCAAWPVVSWGQETRGEAITREWLPRGLGQWGGGTMLVDYKGL